MIDSSRRAPPDLIHFLSYHLPIDARQAQGNRGITLKTFDKFSDLAIPKPLAISLERMEFVSPTPVQAASIPSALEGKDILGTAQTGTGKTGAFGIPMLSSLHGKPGKAALVLAPTRELAAQIHTVLRQMAKGLSLQSCLIVGGESFSRQVNQIDRGVDFIVATPGRMNDHLQQKTLTLDAVSFLVLDEVDRMLDMGFTPQIREILRYMPQERQTLLFSATLPKEAAQMAEQFLKDPIRVVIEPPKSAPIEVRTVQTSQKGKAKQVIAQLGTHTGKVLIFARTQARTERLADILADEGFPVVDLHGGRTQFQRKRALERFRSGSHPIMVATDIAGRGIDVVDITAVLNYDIPRCREDYIHRIGRTGRNGKEGIAVNFITEEDSDSDKVITGKSKPSARGGRGRPGGGRLKRAARHSGGRPSPRGTRSGGRSFGSSESGQREDRPKFGNRPPREGGPKFGSRPPREGGPKFGSRPPREGGPKFGSRPPREGGPKFGSRPPREGGPKFGSRPPRGGSSDGFEDKRPTERSGHRFASPTERGSASKGGPKRFGAKPGASRRGKSSGSGAGTFSKRSGKPGLKPKGPKRSSKSKGPQR